MKEMIFPKALDLDRPKRPRTMFTVEQLTALEEHFQRRPYLVGKVYPASFQSILNVFRFAGTRRTRYASVAQRNTSESLVSE
jgi:hypothetical protein